MDEHARLFGVVKDIGAQASDANDEHPHATSVYGRLIGPIAHARSGASDGTLADRLAIARRTRQREKMESLGTLAGGIAHDFNNLLSVVLGFTELALADAAGTPAIEQHLKEIRAASVRARDLVKLILSFSRRAEHDLHTVDVRAIAAETLRLLRATLPAAVTLDTHLADEALLTVADPSALQQVLLHLCTNAEYAMRPYDGGRLTVRLQRVGSDYPGRAVLLVSDTGEGMTQEIREKIFDPFFTTKPAGEGTGMGLTVVQTLVTELGGTISVDSVPGAGATFRVVLPLTSEGITHGTMPETAQAPTEAIGGAGDGTILLVEDEPALARFAIQALERAGFDVVSCNNGHDALRHLTQSGQRVDLVISDLSMPGLSGERLLREIRLRQRDVPVILMTGYSESLSADDARAAGATTLLLKPFSAAQLMAAVTDAIGSAMDGAIDGAIGGAMGGVIDDSLASVLARKSEVPDVAG